MQISCLLIWNNTVRVSFSMVMFISINEIRLRSLDSLCEVTLTTDFIWSQWFRLVFLMVFLKSCSMIFLSGILLYIDPVK